VACNTIGGELFTERGLKATPHMFADLQSQMQGYWARTSPCGTAATCMQLHHIVAVEDPKKLFAAETTVEVECSRARVFF
jgi:hypothetical protein